MATGAEGMVEEHELVALFLDDGHSGARLDRPGLDGLRYAAEAACLTRCGACPDWRLRDIAA
ncbi:MAG TPA: hypothetical protein VM142_01820 [Acidimicrobiales bacterium]|nr:hypothetical protein [Acidimicrobiales bacterium]